MNASRFRTCADCGWSAEINFYNPQSVYCEGCDQKLGETDRPVKSDLVALEGSEIVSTESGETLATVEWIDDRLETATDSETDQ